MSRNVKSVGYIIFVVPAAVILGVLEAGARTEESFEPVADPLALYGAGIDFDVYRKGEKVGYHKVRFDTDGEDLIVSSRFHLEIRVLFITAFEYLYEAEGRWQDGQLMRLQAAVNDNGSLLSLAAERSGNKLAVRNAEGGFFEQAPIYPTSHWNAAVLPETRVLNTLTGRINSVKIERRGPERGATEMGDITATRYAYTGDFEADVWYDDAGRWVKLRFQARDGSVIDYVCRRCQGQRTNRQDQAVR